MSLSGGLKILLVLIVAVLAAMLYPPLRISALVLTGRSPQCSLPQAVKSYDNARAQIQYKDQILSASQLINKDEHFEQWQTPMGTYWIPAGSRYVLPFNLAEQKRQIYYHGNHRVNAGDIVLDCGANVGVFVREAVNAGAAKVIAIEPAPENVEALNRNFRAEISAGKVVVYPKGVWDKDDFLVLNVDHDNSAADSFVIHPEGSAGSAEKLPLTTIDKLAAELNLPKVHFIKMDIEGAEVKALNGGRQTIARDHPRMSISVYHLPDHPVEVPRAIQSAWTGYRSECGPCAVTSDSRVRPDIMYFHE